MKSSPFKRVLDYLNMVALATKLDEPLPSYIPAKGKGKNKSPTRTGHKHMKYRRMMLKKRNKN
jgi:hypothetical protein